MRHLDPLIGKVEHRAERTRIVIDGRSEQIAAAKFVVDRGIARARGAIDADAPLAVPAEAPSDIEPTADMLRPGNADRRAGDRVGGGALGDQVDAAADAGASGRCAIEERAGTVQDLHRFI